MNINYQENVGLSIWGEWVSLEMLKPVINGETLEIFEPKKLNLGSNTRVIQYSLTGPLRGGIFTIEVVPEGQNRCNLRFHIKNSPVILDSFGIFISGVGNLRSYLRNGFHSWDGCAYEEPENIPNRIIYGDYSLPGYAMTQLIPRNGIGSMVLGFEKHDHFLHTFKFSNAINPPALKIECLWDRKRTESSLVCSSEWLIIFEHPEIEGALLEWSRIVSEASQPIPRVDTEPKMGWSSWYNLYGYISEELILEQLESARNYVAQTANSLQVFQIDDGFTPEMGDWLQVKPQFPHGIAPLMKEIKESGFMPGLWIAPFLIGNRSQLFADHPDWVLKDAQSGLPKVAWKLFGENRWFKRSEEYYILDGTHPHALDYLRIVFRTWRQEWGCEYFKTDFMLYGCMFGPDQVQFYSPGSTRVEVWRKVAAMIREEIGDAFWLGCGCPLWASIGYVDGIRVSGDLGVSWSGDLSAQALLRDLPARNFANHKLWKIDPDCILLRDQYHDLTDNEVESLAIFSGMSGGMIMTSDSLSELSAERKRLFRLILPDQNYSSQYPFLGKSPVIYDHGLGKNGSPIPENLDPVIVQVLRNPSLKNIGTVFVLNTSENALQRTFPIESLGFSGPLYIYRWQEEMVHKDPDWHLHIKLARHQGALFFLTSSPLNELPEKIFFRIS